MVLGVVTTALGTTSTAQSHPSRQVRLARGCHWHWPSHKRVTSTTRWIDNHSPTGIHMPYPATFRSTRAFGPIGCAICARVIRADGVIVKPDDAIAPLDASCIEQANDRRLPIVAAAPESRSRHTFFCLRSLGRTPHGTFLALGVGSQRSRLCLQLLRRIRNAPPAGGCG